MQYLMPKKVEAKVQCQLPDEDPVLPHRLDVASDELAGLQVVYRHNFWVLRWLGLLGVQP